MEDDYRSRCPDNFIWRYFTSDKYPNIAICNICGKYLTCQNYTRNFQSHLIYKHKDTIEEIRQEIRHNTLVSPYLTFYESLQYARCNICNCELTIFNGIEYLKNHMNYYHGIRTDLMDLSENNSGVSGQQSEAEKANASTSTDGQRAGAHSQTAKEQEE